MQSHDFTPSKRFGFCLTLAAGAGLLAAGTIAGRDRAAGARIAGAVVLGAGLARWTVRPLFIQLRDLYASGQQQGYDQGWTEGRRADRPTVVELDPRRIAQAVHPDAASPTR